MKLQIGIFALIGAAAFTASFATVHASQGTKTTWDGIYSEAQAGRGEALYNDKCAKCHGPDGSGGDAPELVGGGFMSDWDGLTMAQLFDRTRSSMPQDNPQSLSRDEAANLMGYLLKKNGFPTGATDLSSDAGALGQIKYVAIKP
jgi:S-disulfanyl-L-cysteine oxidoreductase SoxD